MAPVCAHVADDKYLCCLPNTTTNHLRGFLTTGLRVVPISDQEAEKAPAKKEREAEAPPEVAGVTGLSLPKDVKAYNKKPWKALRDVKAAAVWRAEEIRAKGSGEFDSDAALSGIDVSPFNWIPYDDKMLFVALNFFRLN